MISKKLYLSAMAFAVASASYSLYLATPTVRVIAILVIIVIGIIVFRFRMEPEAEERPDVDADLITLHSADTFTIRHVNAAERQHTITISGIKRILTTDALEHEAKALIVDAMTQGQLEVSILRQRENRHRMYEASVSVRSFEPINEEGHYKHTDLARLLVRHGYRMRDVKRPESHALIADQSFAEKNNKGYYQIRDVMAQGEMA